MGACPLPPVARSWWPRCTVRTLAGIHLRSHSGRTRRHGLRLHQSDVTAVRERLEVSPRKRRRIRSLKASASTSSWRGIVIEEVMVFGGYRRSRVHAGNSRRLLLRETFRGRG